MNINLTMIDIDTGEILASKFHNHVCCFQTPKGDGLTRIMEWVQSCVKGVRTSEHKRLELRVGFCEDSDLFFTLFDDLEKAK